MLASKFHLQLLDSLREEYRSVLLEDWEDSSRSLPAATPGHCPLLGAPSLLRNGL